MKYVKKSIIKILYLKEILHLYISCFIYGFSNINKSFLIYIICVLIQINIILKLDFKHVIYKLNFYKINIISLIYFRF